MADRVDSMTDAEIRTKLAEHGYPVMPITASTRKLLAKKLKMVMDTKGKSQKSNDGKVESRRSLARYSSGEESDIDTNSAKEKRNRRATTGTSMLPPVIKSRRTPVKKDSLKRDSDKGSESDEEKSPVRTREEVETVTTRRVTRTYANDQDDYETGSDSDVDNDKKTSTSLRSNSRSSDYISNILPTNKASTGPPKTPIFSRPSLSRSSDYRSSMSSSEQLNSIRSRLGLTSSLADRPSGSKYVPTLTSSYISTYQPSTSSIDEVESPYLSNFTRRLSSLKAEPPKPTAHLDRDTNNGSTLAPRRTTSINRFNNAEYKSGSDKKFWKSNMVSLALVALVALFFFSVFFMYIVKKNDITSVVDDQHSVIPICQISQSASKAGINCVPKDQVGDAKSLFKVVYPELISQAEKYKCGNPGVLPYLTEREIIDMASAKVKSMDVNQCRKDLNNLQVLLVNNPHWGVEVVQLKNLYTKDAEYVPLTSNELVSQRNKGSIALALSDPSTPISCLFWNTLYSAGSTFVVVGILAVLLLGLQRIYKYYMNYRKMKSEEIYSMVEQIIDVISQETEDSGEPYISVDHVRDTLISPQNREKLASTWDAAVKFIQKNESRVRMEVQSVDGEDCRVWRWIASSSPKRSTSWQGQAFETQEGSVNNLTVSPTPCLKIRHMFEKNDTNPNLRTVIQDVILEKCDHCNILHIDVDRTSGCVYVKCATQTDAGVVYKSLHGWWYDGRLITVKYLRLERYMQRFPCSPSSGPYLKPSRMQRSYDE